MRSDINPLNAGLNPICHLLALLGAHLIPHVIRIRVNTIPKYIPKSTNLSLSFRFPHQNSVCISLLPISVTRAAHIILPE